MDVVRCEGFFSFGSSMLVGVSRKGFQVLQGHCDGIAIEMVLLMLRDRHGCWCFV